MDRPTLSLRPLRAPLGAPLAVSAPLLLALVLAAILAAPARAQNETYTYSAALLGTLGGSQDATPGDDLDNTGFQINLDMVAQPGDHVTVRLGRLGLADGDRFSNDLTDAELSYVTVGGEYRYRHRYYNSGLFLALGGYRLDATDAFSGDDEEETTIGLSLGATGEFAITPWLGVAVELAGHYADFDDAQIFLMGNAGLVVHF